MLPTQHQGPLPKVIMDIRLGILATLPLLFLSGCITGFNGKEFQKAIKGINELNAHTRQMEEAAFRRNQEAYYDMQLRKVSD